MCKGNYAVVLIVAMSFMVGCLSEEIEGESRHEIGSTYFGEASNQRLLKLPELVIRPSEEAARQDASLGPAPGVTYFQTYAIISGQYYAWEYVGASQFITVENHGGAFIDVAVLQYGYGSGGATLGGSSGFRYASEPLCGTLSTIHYCNAGEVVTGFMDYYEFVGPSGGMFSAYTDSIAYPWGRWTDNITVR